MSNTIAHRTHVHHHVPLMPVLAVIVAIAIAAAAIYAINLPETTTTSSTSTEAVYALAPTVVVPEPDNPVFRHDLMRMGATGQLRPYLTNLRHLVEGTSLDPVSTQPYAGTIVSPNYARAANGR